MRKRMTGRRRRKREWKVEYQRQVAKVSKISSAGIVLVLAAQRGERESRECSTEPNAWTRIRVLRRKQGRERG